jgi:hypothetical protein
MNSSNASSSYFYYSLDELLTAHGSTWILDNLNLYLFVIFGIVGALLNLFAFVIFLDAEFTVALYGYLRVFTLNNIVMCLVSIPKFSFGSFRLASWTNSYGAQFWLNFFYSPISNLSYFYGTLLTICILLDRIANFNRHVRSWMTVPYRYVCLIALIVTVVIDSPYFFVFAPTASTYKLNATANITFWYSGTTDFAFSTIGTIITFVVYALRDVLVMGIEIALNIVSVLLLRAYLQKKLKLAASKPGVSNPTGPNQLAPTLTNQATTKIVMSTTAGDGVGDVAITSNPALNKNAVVAKAVIKAPAATTAEKVSSADRRAVIMVGVLCVLSVCEHTLIIAEIVYPYFFFNLNNFILYSLGDFTMLFKRFLDFFIFFFFNKNFKKVCKRYLGF